MDISKRSTWATLVGVFLFLGLLMYGQVLGYDFVRWDDGLLIYENPAIRGLSLENIKAMFTTYDPELYIPVTLLSYQFDYMIASSNAGMYHAQNVLLHVLNAVFVTGIAKILLKKSPIALLTGVLFLVHPLHTEAVAWASARKDVLSTFFFLLSMLSYLQLRSTDHRKWYVVSLIAFLLGLMAKVTVLTLPVVLLLTVWFTDGTVGRKTIVRAIPYAVLSAIFAVIAFYGKTAVLESATTMETIAMSGKSTVFYLSKLLLPVHLSVLYPYNHEILLSSPDFLIPMIIVLLIAVATLLSLKYTRFIFFAVFFFAITLAPSLLNFAKAGTYYIASDRYAYIPSIGIFMLVAVGLQYLSSKLQNRNIFSAVSAVVVIALAIMASMQSRVWANSETLFSNVLKYHPDSYVALNNIGNVYRRQGEVTSAIASYKKALMVDTPLDAVENQRKAKVLSNLGSSLRAEGKLDEALAQFTEALRLDDQSPQVHLGLAITYQQMGKYNAARSAFLKAIALQPTLAVAHLNLGALYIAMGNTEDAIKQYEETIQINPYFPQAHYNLGIALRKLERNREARDAFEQAVELQPDFTAARINLGIIYAERKETDAAIEQFMAVLQYDPENARAISALRQLGAM